PTRSPWTEASIERGGSQATSTTRSRIRYGRGGATTPWKTAPATSPGPSTRSSLSHPHQVSKRSKCSTVDQTCWGGIGKLNRPAYSITEGEPTRLGLGDQLVERVGKPGEGR